MKNVIDWARVTDKQLAEGDEDLGRRIQIWVDMHEAQGHEVFSRRVEPEYFDITNQSSPKVEEVIVSLFAGVEWLVYEREPRPNWVSNPDGTFSFRG